MSRLREVKIEKAVRVRKVVKELRCDLTPEEQRIKGQRLAHQEKEIYDLRHSAKKSAEDFKERIDLATRQMTGTASVLRNGYEYRAIECDEIHDYSTGTVRTKRTDSKETIDERPMNEQERQMTFMAEESEILPHPAPKQPEANA